jgi:phenylalanyl-tRNA synthetase beta chain
MRTSLRASVLQAIASNLRRERGTVALFETARVFLSRPDDLPEEREIVIGGVGGVRLGRWGEPTDTPVDFFDAKGLLEEIFERCGARVSYAAGDEFAFLRGATAQIDVDGERAGVVGQVHPQVASRFEIEGPVFIFEVYLERLLAAAETTARFRPLSRFPAVMQDIALIVDASVAAEKVTTAIETSALVGEARLFDVYEGPPLPEGKRSLAFAIQFQALDRTLTEAEVADARRRIIRRLEHEFRAELRGA